MAMWSKLSDNRPVQFSWGSPRERSCNTPPGPGQLCHCCPWDPGCYLGESPLPLPLSLVWVKQLSSSICPENGAEKVKFVDLEVWTQVFFSPYTWISFSGCKILKKLLHQLLVSRVSFKKLDIFLLNLLCAFCLISPGAFSISLLSEEHLCSLSGLFPSGNTSFSLRKRTWMIFSSSGSGILLIEYCTYWTYLSILLSFLDHFAFLTFSIFCSF